MFSHVVCRFFCFCYVLVRCLVCMKSSCLLILLMTGRQLGWTSWPVVSIEASNAIYTVSVWVNLFESISIIFIWIPWPICISLYPEYPVVEEDTCWANVLLRSGANCVKTNTKEKGNCDVICWWPLETNRQKVHPSPIYCLHNSVDAKVILWRFCSEDNASSNMARHL